MMVMIFLPLLLILMLLLLLLLPLPMDLAPNALHVRVQYRPMGPNDMEALMEYFIQYSTAFNLSRFKKEQKKTLPVQRATTVQYK